MTVTSASPGPRWGESPTGIFQTVFRSSVSKSRFAGDALGGAELEVTAEAVTAPAGVDAATAGAAALTAAGLRAANTTTAAIAAIAATAAPVTRSSLDDRLGGGRAAWVAAVGASAPLLV